MQSLVQWRRIVLFLLVATAALAGHCQTLSARGEPAPSARENPSTPAEDISGMYSFVASGEFLQINIEDNRVSGYISRRGDLESDRGTFLDQFFEQASIHGHDIVFKTRILHGEWFEFKGRFERGPAKSKEDGAYYILRGVLTEFSSDGKNPSGHEQKVEFKWIGQPQDDEGKKAKPKKSP